MGNMISTYMMCCLLQITIFQITPLMTDKCPESVPTTNYVDKCPENKIAWMLAAKNKQCENVAKAQKCSREVDFVYHCVLADKATRLVEVCVPRWYMNGYCTAYDTEEQRLVNYIDADCTEFSENACPTRYLSTDIFKYTGCYNLVESRSKLDVSCSSLDNSGDVSSRLFVPITVTLSVCIVILTTVIVVQCLLKYKLRRKYQHAGENNNVNNNGIPNNQEAQVEEDASHYVEEYIDERTGKTLWLRYPRTKTMVKYIYKNDKKHSHYDEISPISEHEEPENDMELDDL